MISFPFKQPLLQAKLASSFSLKFIHIFTSLTLTASQVYILYDQFYKEDKKFYFKQEMRGS